MIYHNLLGFCFSILFILFRDSYHLCCIPYRGSPSHFYHTSFSHILRARGREIAIILLRLCFGSARSTWPSKDPWLWVVRWSDLEGVDPFSVGWLEDHLASLFEAQRSATLRFAAEKKRWVEAIREAHESPPCLMIKTPNLRPRGNPRGQGVRNKSYCNRRQRMAEDGRGGGGENEVTSDSLRFMKVPLLLTMVSQKKHHSSPAVGCACCDVFHCWGAAKAILPMTVEAKDGRRNVQTWLKCQEMWRVLASKRIARIAELSKIVAESLCVLTGKNVNF